MRIYTKQEFDDLILIAHHNIEQFRHEATSAHTAYDQQSRKKLRKIKGKSLFYSRYYEFFYPIYKKLNRMKPYISLELQLEKSLVVNPTDAASLTEQLYRDRTIQLLHETVSVLPRRSHYPALQILRTPLEQVDTLLAAYRQAVLYRDVASQLHIVTYDPYRSFVQKMITQLRIRHDRKKTLRKEQKRIRIIERELNKIDTANGDILHRIATNNLEMIPILALRNEFSKKTDRTKQTNSRAQLDHFDSIVKKFIDEQIDRYISTNPDAPLHALTAKKHTIEGILQDVFALDNTKRNQLVTLFSHYSQLYKEHTVIRAAQAARNQYINQQI